MLQSLLYTVRYDILYKQYICSYNWYNIVFLYTNIIIIIHLFILYNYIVLYSKLLVDQSHAKLNSSQVSEAIFNQSRQWT